MNSGEEFSSLNGNKNLGSNTPLINKKKKEKTLQQNGKFYGNILAEEEEGPLAVVDTDGASEAGVYVLVEVLIRCIETNIVSY